MKAEIELFCPNCSSEEVLVFADDEIHNGDMFECTGCCGTSIIEPDESGELVVKFYNCRHHRMFDEDCFACEIDGY